MPLLPTPSPGACPIPSGYALVSEHTTTPFLSGGGWSPDFQGRLRGADALEQGSQSFYPEHLLNIYCIRSSIGIKDTAVSSIAPVFSYWDPGSGELRGVRRRNKLGAC